LARQSPSQPRGGWGRGCVIPTHPEEEARLEKLIAGEESAEKPV
jgi:hypothetical protein